MQGLSPRGFGQSDAQEESRVLGLMVSVQGFVAVGALKGVFLFECLGLGVCADGLGVWGLRVVALRFGF